MKLEGKQLAACVGQRQDRRPGGSLSVGVQVETVDHDLVVWHRHRQLDHAVL